MKLNIVEMYLEVSYFDHSMYFHKERATRKPLAFHPSQSGSSFPRGVEFHAFVTNMT